MYRIKKKNGKWIKIGYIYTVFAYYSPHKYPLLYLYNMRIEFIYLSLVYRSQKKILHFSPSHMENIFSRHQTAKW